MGLAVSDIEINDPWNRSISARLYTGDIEQRLRQEIVLGIGGSEVLETLGIKHSVLHLNEGHAAFAILERIRDRVQNGMSYEEAAEQVRRTSVFTTHTPVPAGHDIFPFQLIEKYFYSYWPAMGIDHDRFLQFMFSFRKRDFFPVTGEFNGYFCPLFRLAFYLEGTIVKFRQLF